MIGDGRVDWGMWIVFGARGGVGENFRKVADPKNRGSGGGTSGGSWTGGRLGIEGKIVKKTWEGEEHDGERET